MPHWLPGQIREYLGKYLFSGDDAFKKVSVLSGGERGRLALAKLALQDTNLLLLDEPTNHLDIPSQEVLEAVLDDYAGTILLVTHDRYLIDALGTQIWEVEPDESTLTLLKVHTASAGWSGNAWPHCVLVEETKAVPAARYAGLWTRLRKKNAAGSRGCKNWRTRSRHSKRNWARSVSGSKIPPADPAKVAQLGKEYQRIQLEMDVWLAEWEQLQVRCEI